MDYSKDKRQNKNIIWKYLVLSVLLKHDVPCHMFFLSVFVITLLHPLFAALQFSAVKYSSKNLCVKELENWNVLLKIVSWIEKGKKNYLNIIVIINISKTSMQPIKDILLRHPLIKKILVRSFDLLQYNNSAGNDISSLGTEPIFCNVFTGGK